MKKRGHSLKRSNKRDVKRNVKVKTPEDRFLWKLVGAALVSLAIFFAAALATYDWQANHAAGKNLVGAFGNMFAFGCYKAFGFAAWFLPSAMLIGAMKMFVPIPNDVEEIPNRRICFRIAGLILMFFAVTGLFQLAGKWCWVRELSAFTHIGSNVGGKVGYWVMTCCLEKAVAAFAAAFIALGVLAAAICMVAGLKTVRGWFAAAAEIDWGELFGGGADAVGEPAEEGRTFTSSKPADRSALSEILSIIPSSPMILTAIWRDSHRGSAPTIPLRVRRSISVTAPT